MKQVRAEQTYHLIFFWIMKDLLSSIKFKKNKLLERFSCHFLWSKEKKSIFKWQTKSFSPDWNWVIRTTNRFLNSFRENALYIFFGLLKYKNNFILTIRYKWMLKLALRSWQLYWQSQLICLWMYIWIQGNILWRM